MEQIDKLDNDKLIDNMVNCILNGRNIILHGPGGVGKSYNIKKIVAKLRLSMKNVYTTATTGVAAINLSSNCFPVSTLHRFAGIGTGQLELKELVYRVISEKKSLNRWIKTQILVIDEISMLGAELFDKLDHIAKYVRKNNLPFGGIKLVVSGDFLQLPPVKDDWVFKSKNWEELDFRPFILEVPYRYDDNEFFYMLLRIRKGEQNEKDIRILNARVSANKKVSEIIRKAESEGKCDFVKPTMFYSTKKDVNKYNQIELDKLPGAITEFIAKDSIVTSKKGLTLDQYTKILEDDLPQKIGFKVGAQVMLKVNLSVECGLVNGSRGVVSEIISGEALIVKFINGTIRRVEIYERKYEDKHAIVIRKQIPFILAYASTIHKSQSSTLDYTVVDLGPTLFTDGQAYVALSRCRALKGLFVSNFYPNRIKADTKAKEYAQLLEKKAMEEEKGKLEKSPADK